MPSPWIAIAGGRRIRANIACEVCGRPMYQVPSRLGRPATCSRVCRTQRVNLTGRVVGRLTVLREGRPDDDTRRYWHCRCACGRLVRVRQDQLTSGVAKSCGCLTAERAAARKRTHGLSMHNGRLRPEFGVWWGMKQRCFNKANHAYQWYGARGITVCERWRDSFAAFFADMGPRPDADDSIDRIDNDGHYEPGNCRWATRQQQRANKRPDAITMRHQLRSPDNV